MCNLCGDVQHDSAVSRRAFLKTGAAVAFARPHGLGHILVAEAFPAGVLKQEDAREDRRPRAELLLVPDCRIDDVADGCGREDRGAALFGFLGEVAGDVARRGVVAQQSRSADYADFPAP